jgi:hypothetical protein
VCSAISAYSGTASLREETLTHSGTGTIARTASITMVDVRHVMWRIASDLRVLRIQHGMIDQEREEGILNDLTAFIYRNYADQIEFQFVSNATGTAAYRVRYSLSRSWAGEEDDDSGGLRYRDLRGTTFSAVISFSDTWKQLSADEKASFKAGLQRSWGPAADVADGSGYWTTDRTYGSGALGAERSVFRAF